MRVRFTVLVFLILAAYTDRPLAQRRWQAYFGTPNGSDAVSGQQASDAALDARIRGFESFGNGAGFAYTRETIFWTDDDGRAWLEIKPSKRAAESIAQAYFTSADSGWILLTDVEGSALSIRRTEDGGRTWDIHRIARPFPDGDLENASLEFSSMGEWQLQVPIQTSSNFRGSMTLASRDWLDWELRSRIIDLNTAERDQKGESVSGDWMLRSDGTCLGIKSGCVQETHLYSSGSEITPLAIKDLAGRAREIAEGSAVRMFAAGPGGTTRTSLNRGFDMCNAPTAAQMQTWWNTSPLYDMNIYMSGRNRACSAQPNLSAAWVNQVTAMGWGLIPTVVGYQSPCTASTTTAKLSYDPATAETQGRGEADIAVTAANNLGLTVGSILYYDMERYDPPSPDTLGCRAATTVFLKGWTERIRELGYKSGVYGSPKNAQEDWVGLGASKPDAIWMARWDNIISVWTYTSFPTFPTNEWTNHQRIKQWQAPHNETWGGVTFNIDGNNSDGPVAGVAIAANKNADFDGDGKSDVSVFRPTDGVWYVLSSINSTFSGTGFGVNSDVLAPGDFDGDGKTDYCVFRPSDGTWYTLSKAGTFNSRQFGSAGDIPVPADYNGDGKTDIAVFRPSNGFWYIANSDSKGTYSFIQFGQADDKPVPGDYDGDGKSEIAVYRPSNGTWYIMRIADLSFYGVSFGISTDLPAQGDYDGDGKTDQAVYRDGTWYLMKSFEGFAAIQFGLPGDIPATGDFDGDGKSDITVFRPSNGAWYTSRSQAGFWAIGFGQNGDRPIEAAYLPQ